MQRYCVLSSPTLPLSTGAYSTAPPTTGSRELSSLVAELCSTNLAISSTRVRISASSSGANSPLSSSRCASLSASITRSLFAISTFLVFSHNLLYGSGPYAKLLSYPELHNSKCMLDEHYGNIPITYLRSPTHPVVY